MDIKVKDSADFTQFLYNLKKIWSPIGVLDRYEDGYKYIHIPNTIPSFTLTKCEEIIMYYKMSH